MKTSVAMLSSYDKYWNVSFCGRYFNCRYFNYLIKQIKKKDFLKAPFRSLFFYISNKKRAWAIHPICENYIFDRVIVHCDSLTVFSPGGSTPPCSSHDRTFTDVLLRESRSKYIFYRNTNCQLIKNLWNWMIFILAS